MTDTLIPSSGERRPGRHIDLNHLGFEPGERVLFEVEFGQPEIGTIEAVTGNWATIVKRAVFMPALKHRLRPGAGEAAEADLLARLAVAYAQGAHLYEAARAPIVRAWNREQRGAAK